MFRWPLYIQVRTIQVMAIRIPGCDREINPGHKKTLGSSKSHEDVQATPKVIKWSGGA